MSLLFFHTITGFLSYCIVFCLISGLCRQIFVNLLLVLPCCLITSFLSEIVFTQCNYIIKNCIVLTFNSQYIFYVFSQDPPNSLIYTVRFGVSKIFHFLLIVIPYTNLLRIHTVVFFFFSIVSSFLDYKSRRDFISVNKQFSAISHFSLLYYQISTNHCMVFLVPGIHPSLNLSKSMSSIDLSINGNRVRTLGA